MNHPIHLRYQLNRRQRLIPHLKSWRLMGPCLVVSWTVWQMVAWAEGGWFLIPALIGFGSCRAYVVGWLDVVLCPNREMDVIIEPLGIGFMAGRDRRFVHMDGLRSIQQLTPDVWTISHSNGTVINVPSEWMTESCRAHIVAAIEGKWAYLKHFVADASSSMREFRPR